MAFPASLTLVTVAIQFDVPPSGGATGSVTFISRQPLNGTTDGSIVPPFALPTSLATDGSGTIALPANNDPQWSPSGWAYTVQAQVNGTTRYGTLQLDYQATSVQLADLIQWDGAAVTGTTYATLAQLTAHTGATTGVHGIADTAALIVEGDSRLTNARTPTAHAASHADGGTDEVALDGSQITTGTVAAARLPNLSTTYLPLTGGTVTGNVTVQGAGGTKSYGFRTNGSNLDLEGAGADIFLSVWSGAGATGTQRNYARFESGAGIAHALGRWLFAAGAFDGTGVADLDPSTGVAAVGAKNGLANIRLAGFKATAGAPTTGTWVAGDVVLDSAGAWHLCTTGGTPGTWT